MLDGLIHVLFAQLQSAEIIIVTSEFVPGSARGIRAAPENLSEALFQARRPGRLAGLSGKERSAILLDLLGRKVRVVIDTEFIDAA